MTCGLEKKITKIVAFMPFFLLFDLAFFLSGKPVKLAMLDKLKATTWFSTMVNLEFC